MQIVCAVWMMTLSTDLGRVDGSVTCIHDVWLNLTEMFCSFSVYSSLSLPFPFLCLIYLSLNCSKFYCSLAILTITFLALLLGLLLVIRLSKWLIGMHINIYCSYPHTYFSISGISAVSTVDQE